MKYRNFSVERLRATTKLKKDTQCDFNESPAGRGGVCQKFNESSLIITNRLLIDNYIIWWLMSACNLHTPSNEPIQI